MDSVDQLQMLHEAVKLWVIMDRVEKNIDIPEVNSNERDHLMMFRQLIYPQHCHSTSLTEHLRSAAVHMQRYLNCDAAIVVSRCTYADLWALVARIDNLDSFHLEQLDSSDLEDGEILTAVKLEPRTSEDEDMQDCRTAAISRRTTRFCSSAEPRHNLRHASNDGLRLGVDCDDGVSGVRVPTSDDVSSPVTRNNKRRRPSKDATSPGQPGRPRASPVWSFFDYISENNESICKIDTDIGPCGAILKGKNSTNLKKHVECFHPEVYGLCVTSTAITGGGFCVYRRRYSENVGRRRGSPVWEHFEYLADSDMSICKVDTVDGRHCATMLKGKNPTNLKKHLMSHHEQIFDQYWDVNGALRTHQNGSSSAAE